MLYGEYIKKATDLTVVKADNGLFYLEPLWKDILYSNDMDVKTISGTKISWTEILDVLKLEVEKQNTINSNKSYIINWIYDLITTQVEPAILQEETDYIKQVIEFMKVNHESQTLKDQEEWTNFKNS